MRTNTGVTVFCRHICADGATRFHRTFVPAVFWEPRKGANIAAGAVSSADDIRIYIPMSAATGKIFISPLEYEKKANARGFWTLTAGSDYIVKGNAPKVSGEDGIKNLKKTHDVHKITVVDEKKFGGRALWHWEVWAK